MRAHPIGTALFALVLTVGIAGMAALNWSLLLGP